MTDPAQRPISDLRREDVRFVTGRGRYIADLAGEETLHAAFVRSQEAHARLTSVDPSDAVAGEGVVAVWTAADLDLPDQPLTWPGVELAPMPRPPLARDVVRYVSEPVAIVVATSARAAADAADLVWVDYEPLPAVSSPLEALKDEVLLHPGAGTNVVEAAAIGADVDDTAYEVCVDIALVNQRLGPTSIEPLGILARPMAAGGVETWISGQGAHRVQAPLAEMLGVPVEVHIHPRRRRSIRHERTVLPRVRGGVRRDTAARPRGDVDSDPPRAPPGRDPGAGSAHDRSAGGRL